MLMSSMPHRITFVWYSIVYNISYRILLYCIVLYCIVVLCCVALPFCCVVLCAVVMYCVDIYTCTSLGFLYRHLYSLSRTVHSSSPRFLSRILDLPLTLSGPGFSWAPACPWARGGGGGGRRGRKVPVARNSKTIHGIEMKFGRVVENHKLMHLV